MIESIKHHIQKDSKEYDAYLQRYNNRESYQSAATEKRKTFKEMFGYEYFLLISGGVQVIYDDGSGAIVPNVDIIQPGMMVPSDAMVEKIVTDGWENRYGKNGGSLELGYAIIGAKFLSEWLFKNR